MELDIHNYAANFARVERQVSNSSLSPRNKELLFAYREACLIRNVCGRVRLIRALPTLLQLGTMLDKDFDQASKADIEALVGHLVRHQPAYTPQTISTFKSILRTFMTWVVDPETFPDGETPPVVAWIHTYVKARDKKRLERKDLLTPDDIEALLSICHNTRDAALIAVLWETGARVAEIGNLQLKHVTKHQFGYVLDLHGKTGHRSPLIVSSAPHVTVWLNRHPFRGNPESPLWVHYQYNDDPVVLEYPAIRKLLRRHFERAKLAKPFHPHVFRHSRATHVLAQGIMNEQQAKAYFGWTADSGMLATYSHLIDQDANDAIMRENNVVPVKQRHDDLKPRTCSVCQELNPPQGTHCTRCGTPLRPDSLYAERSPAAQQAILADLLQLAVRNGVTQDVLDVVHKAGLGSTLRQLTSVQPADQPVQQTNPAKEEKPGVFRPPANAS